MQSVKTECRALIDNDQHWQSCSNERRRTSPESLVKLVPGTKQRTAKDVGVERLAGPDKRPNGNLLLSKAIGARSQINWRSAKQLIRLRSRLLSRGWR